MAEKDFAPADNAEYSSQKYWDQRFAEEEHHEWLVSFGDVRDLVEEFCSPEDRILLVGCGNSAFTKHLFDAGFKRLVSTDFSEVVIDTMRARHSDDLEGVQWEVQDMRDLGYAEGSFDVVIDKAATDAILAAEGSVWDPDPRVVDDMERTCRSAYRVLRPGGRFIQITFQQPHFRRRYLARPGLPWAVAHRDVPVGFGYFFFVCTVPEREREEAPSEAGPRPAADA